MPILGAQCRLTTFTQLAIIGLVTLACGVLPVAQPTEEPLPEATLPDAPPDIESEPSGPVEIMLADIPRNTSPDVAQTELSELVAGNNAFTFDLYQAIQGGEGNIVYSPYSVSLALAMTYAGARGETEHQMADTLHFTLPQERLHSAFNVLDLEFSNLGQPTGESDAPSLRLNIANAIWGQVGYPFHTEYLNTLAQNYGAGLQLLDFASAPDDSCVTINDWVSDETEGLIEDLLPPDTITTDTRLVLTNAIYFYGTWRYPFPDELSQDGTFYLLDGSQVLVPTMFQPGELPLRYAGGDGYQAVELLYEGDELAMLILLPEAERFIEFEASLDADRFSAIVGDLAFGDPILLSMPRFEFETPSLSLTDTLSSMGMPAAFDQNSADFSGMADTSSNPGLFISDVVHKAYIRVDEVGTEAAAATGVDMAETSLPQYITINVNRPFVFVIYDMQNGAILFMGRVLDPRE